MTKKEQVKNAIPDGQFLVLDVAKRTPFTVNYGAVRHWLTVLAEEGYLRVMKAPHGQPHVYERT